MADDVKNMNGREVFDYASDRLNLDIGKTGADKIPEKGACLFVCNHPTGIADGIAVYDVIKHIRDDSCFFANVDICRICPRLEDNVVPVVMPAEERTMESSKETLRQATQALKNGRAVVIFPSGSLARKQGGELQEKPWEETPFTLARKHELTIIPVHVAGPSSSLFHFFDLFSKELRDVTLFYEFLNKKEGHYEVTVGKPVEMDDIDDQDDDELTQALRKFTSQKLGNDPNAEFKVRES